MKKIFVSVLLISLVFLNSCELVDTSDRACSNLEEGMYKFPELPENHEKTGEEVDRFWDLPEDVSSCISTGGLIQTVLDYPNLGLIMVGSTPQLGYTGFVRERFRGARALETRVDRGTELLKWYRSVASLGYEQDWEPIEIGRHQVRMF